jgi:hypothetical protein
MMAKDVRETQGRKCKNIFLLLFVVVVVVVVVVVENTTNLDERLAKGPTSAHHIHGGI